MKVRADGQWNRVQISFEIRLNNSWPLSRESFSAKLTRVLDSAVQITNSIQPKPIPACFRETRQRRRHLWTCQSQPWKETVCELNHPIDVKLISGHESQTKHKSCSPAPHKGDYILTDPLEKRGKTTEPVQSTLLPSKRPKCQSIRISLSLEKKTSPNVTDRPSKGSMGTGPSFPTIASITIPSISYRKRLSMSSQQ